MNTNYIINADSLEGIKTLEDNSIDCIITSPPYWALRDYGVNGQLGQESKVEDYINNLCNIMDEAKRVLKEEGTCWVNIGDTYGGTGSKASYKDPKYKDGRNGQVVALNSSMPSKCLVQIPARFAIEMASRGWILRNEIIWWKRNAMPSSAIDRFTVDFEKIFLFTKSTKYYFEQQLEPYREGMNRWGGDKLKAVNTSSWDDGTGQATYRDRDMRPNKEGKNKRTVWDIPTEGIPNNHFASYPEKLIETPVKAGCPEGGVVLDPFMGSGTTGIVAKKLNRNYIGIDINKEYCKMAEKRIFDEIGLFS